MNDGQQNKHPQEEEIDLLELALKVWAERRWILKCCSYAVIVGLVIAFSIPKEYTATATIAPELSDGKSGGGLSSLAAMAGFNINTSSGADAIYPDLYPDIVSSTPLYYWSFQYSSERPGGDNRYYTLLLFGQVSTFSLVECDNFCSFQGSWMGGFFV